MKKPTKMHTWKNEEEKLRFFCSLSLAFPASVGFSKKSVVEKVRYPSEKVRYLVCFFFSLHRKQ
jgi:hypothetical protein